MYRRVEMKRLAIFFVLSILLIAGNSAAIMAQNTATQDSETYIIVYDEAHNQYFNSANMSTALHSLNDSLDTNSLDVTIKLVTQKESFNNTNIQGADLVIISNPGKDTNGDLPDISTTESDSLKNFANIGGSVLWLSNPLSNNENITAHTQPLNDLIFSTFRASVTTSSATDQDVGTVIVDDFNYVNNNTFVKLSPSNISNKTLTSEVNNITSANDGSLLYYGGKVEETTGLTGKISGNTSSTAYVYNKDFEISEYQNSPRWMYGQSFGKDAGNGLLIGSTVMFSDMKFDNSSRWIDQANNLEFFQNSIAWLLGITPLKKVVSIVNQNFAYFLRTNIIAAVALGFGFLLVTFGFFARKKRVSFSQIFNIFRKGDDSGSDSKSGKKSSQKQKKQSKSKRRKRT